MSNFHVGQKVVCVRDELAPTLTKGSIYTIKAVLPGLGVTAIGDLMGFGILVDEAEPDGDGFDPRRFRPVAKRKTDISQFQRMLTDTKVEEPA